MQHKLPMAAYRPALLAYNFDESANCLRHNFERDLHMFVLWEHARPSWERILDDIARRFVPVHVRHITWPESDVDDNFLRLYGSAPMGSMADATVFKRKEIVGAGTFMLVVVEDANPVYVFDRTFSRKVEVVNRHIVEAKTEYRAWTGGGFRVHSSNSLGEFYRDMSLLVGIDDLDMLLGARQPDLTPRHVRSSLAGSQGWANLGELFRHLNRAARYVVLRNFESLPERLEEGDADIDALCDSPTDLAAISNARVVADRAGKFACETLVAGQRIAFDLRTVGDGYFDARWQAAVLSAAMDRQGVSVPSPPDHFFTLLYHAKVHKPTVKPAYQARLRTLASAVGLSHYVDRDLADDDVAVDLLGGYMASRQFRVELPSDLWVRLNGAFVARLRSHGLMWEQERVASMRSAAALIARLPFLWRWRRRLSAPLAGLYRRAAAWFFRRGG